MSVLRVYDFPGESRDVRFATITPAGFRILAALDNIARDWPRDLFLTCGTEGVHKGTVHKKGSAYDVRSKDCATLEEKHTLVHALILRLCEKAGERVFEVSGGWANDRFFAFLENPGGPNEHVHVQLRQGVSYP